MHSTRLHLGCPIKNVRVRFAVPEGKRVRNVTLLVEMPYHQQQTGSILEVLIPRMETYQAVRMDLE